ncbi:MAG: phosphoribosylamine--glycine ligase [Ignavibacteriae bacterium HGW-Ignavibacteriae-1]|jgi:phosphoribosylamine--glycine ligase|nr:MAG: phosphoribosylamine--glycine ligase [Ignavibacteriae bacterium HGW-Ignavibacteriae-1]
MKTNILLIGSGGREHALARAIAESPSAGMLYALPGNPGILKTFQHVNARVEDFNSISQFCKQFAIDLVVVGPEQPLADGLADRLILEGINVFGPISAAAKLESSKDFAKAMMLKYKVPTAAYRTFTASQYDEAHRYIDGHTLPIVLKADGLAAGKGVIIAENHFDAHNALNEMFSGLFGNAGNRVVIEEFLRGEEASIFAITDGTDYFLTPASQDHKRQFDNDEGKNTGGMGAFAPAPIVTKSVLQKVEERVIKPLLEGMQKEGTPFIGCLYCGLMIENDEPSVVEFNVRFGDPETQAVLELLEGDFAKLLYTAATGKIDRNAVKVIENTFSTCVVLASGGYPDDYEKGFEITGIEDAINSGANVYHAGTKSETGMILTNGGRVLGVTAKGDSLAESIANVYDAVSHIVFYNMINRKDIGFKGLKFF